MQGWCRGVQGGYKKIQNNTKNTKKIQKIQKVQKIQKKYKKNTKNTKIRPCPMQRCVGHTAWAPEGREGRSQGGPKGHRLEVGARRAPKLLVSNILHKCLQILLVFSCPCIPVPSLLTDQSVTNIFEYSNILVTNIYSDIRSYQFFFYKYIRTFIRIKFVCTNIFGHSLVSVLECKT